MEMIVYLKKICNQKVISIILFFALFSFGFLLAQRKPLWNDELHTQYHSIDNASYADILLIRIEEGNRCPLYYLMHKVVCDLFKYRRAERGLDIAYVLDPKGQIVLRAVSNLTMSLSIALIFYFFARYYSYASGIYSLFISLTSFMVWAYWVEARPYSVWFFLTTVQSLLFLYAMKQETLTKSVVAGFVVVHIMLTLTVFFSVTQIIAVSFLLFLLRKESRKYILRLAIIPILLCLVFYFRTPKGMFLYRFGRTVTELITENIPIERMFIIGLYFVWMCIVYYKRKRSKETSYQRLVKEDNLRGEFSFLGLFILVFLAVYALIVALKIVEVPAGSRGFSIPSRFFICLAPVGIIATSVFSIRLVNVFKNNKWMLINILLLLGGLLIIRALRTFVNVFDWGFY